MGNVTIWDRLIRAAVSTGLAVAFVAALAVEAVAIAQSWGIQYWLVGGPAAAIVCVLALLRRRQPAVAAGAGLAVAALAVLTAWLADLPTEPGPAMALALAVLIGAAIRALPLAQAAAIGGSGLAVVAASCLTAGPSSAGAALAINGVAWLAGAATGSALRHRDERARATVEKVRQEERLELARELHDVVAHHITAVLIHAQATHVLARKDPTKVPDALADIEAAASEGLVAMRRVVGILRDTDDAPPVTSGTESLRALVERFSRQGLPVRLRTPEADQPRPPEVTSTIYRIVQEALTNVARHAPLATSVTVAVVQDPQGVTVEIADETPPAPVKPARNGYGLLGMRERTAALGGTLRAGPRAGGGWSVIATLPVPAKRTP